MPPASDLARTAGLVLAGGRSSRFGADKALAHLGDELLLDRALRPLAALAAVGVSAKDGSAVAMHALGCGMQVIADDPNGVDGPLAGVLAGLDWAHGQDLSFLATTPCDAPLLPLDLVSRLLAGRGSAPAAFAMTPQGAHPLCAVWDIRLRASLRAALAEGKHPAVRAYLAQIGATPVRFELTHAFANANTRSDLADLERCL